VHPAVTELAEVDSQGTLRALALCKACLRLGRVFIRYNHIKLSGKLAFIGSLDCQHAQTRRSTVLKHATRCTRSDGCYCLAELLRLRKVTEALDTLLPPLQQESGQAMTGTLGPVGV
jgi:hypothetical protein